MKPEVFGAREMSRLSFVLLGLAETGKPLSGPGEQLRGVCAGAKPGDQKEGHRLVRAQ